MWDLKEQLKHLRIETAAPPPSILPPGEIESTPLGSHYVIGKSYPHDHFHGNVRLSRFSSADLQSLMTLMREKGNVPERSRILFLDTETTGIQGGTGMCPFLVGVGYFSGDEFCVTQFFIRDFDEEPSMLLALQQLLERFDLLITYNGMAFDVPLLETRFTLARLDNAFEGMAHFDLLFTARRLWRQGHGSCRLTALESEMVAFFRGPDIPGAMIPRAYFDYIEHRRNSALASVFTHNVHDVVSLAALTVRACDRVVLEPAEFDDPLDLYSLARVMENSADWRRAVRLYDMAIQGGLPEPIRRKALENLSVICRREGEHTQSLEICLELMRYPEFSIAAYEGAAIYHERQSGDLESALRVLEEGLTRADSPRSKKLLENRYARLQRSRTPLLS
jgi:uncharacterized protein